jgi:RecQ-mediated genome instability protein 1
MPRAVNSSHPTGFGTIRPCSTNVTNGGEQGISMPRAVNSSHPTGLGTIYDLYRVHLAISFWA